MGRVLSCAVVLAVVAAALGSEVNVVVPLDYKNAPGTSTFLGPHASTARTYQMLIHESQLVDLVGLPLNGITWRLPTSATVDWPATDVNYDFYDIYLSGSVAPADRSLTFAENIVGPQTKVRTGPLTVTANSYTFGNVPNHFGPTIEFDEWVYSGGHLLVEIRHAGNTVSSRSVDAIGTTTPGYGTLFSACWASGANATSGSQGNFTVAQFSAVPEPTTMVLLGLGALLALRRRG